MFVMTLPLFAAVILPRTWDCDHFETVEELSAGTDPPSGHRCSTSRGKGPCLILV